VLPQGWNKKYRRLEQVVYASKCVNTERGILLYTNMGAGGMRCVYRLAKSLACRFLVMVGSLITKPSSSLDILTWQPRRLVSVRPKAKSSMSFSSSSGSSILSNISGSETITWQVEQAHEPPHAPSISRSLACAGRIISSAFCEFRGRYKHTNVEQVVAVGYYKGVFIAFLVDKGDLALFTGLGSVQVTM